MESDSLILLEIGLACVHGSKVNYTISYRNPDFPGLFYHLADGGYAIDKSDPLAALPGLAIVSPMVDCKLVDDQIDKMSPDAADSMVLSALASCDSGYGPIAKLAKAEAVNPSSHAGPFDYISPSAFADWWAKRGAMVGRRKGDFVEWFDGTQTEIVEPVQ